MPPRTSVMQFGQQGFSLKAELEKFWGAQKDPSPALTNSAPPVAEGSATDSAPCATDAGPPKGKERPKRKSPSPPSRGQGSASDSAPCATDAGPPAGKERAKQKSPSPASRGRGATSDSAPCATDAGPPAGKERAKRKSPSPASRGRGKNKRKDKSPPPAGRGAGHKPRKLRTTRGVLRSLSSRSSSSSSSQPVVPQPKRKKPEGAANGFREPRKSKWDAPPHISDFLSQQRGMAGIMPKKRREVYCGNLSVGQVTCTVLRETFAQLFLALPGFKQQYPDMSDPIRSVAFPPDHSGMFAFVEFMDEVLASTAILMSGFELFGRAVKVGRPQGFTPATGLELPPLDVSPLRKVGLLPAKPDFVLPSIRNTVSTKLRELYFGNLLVGKVTPEIMTEFLTPALMELPEYLPIHGPPVCRVQMGSNGGYCFVQFQSEEMAARVIPIFDDTELFGRKLRVGRPQNCPTQADLQQPTPALPAPLASSDIIEAAAGAAVRKMALV